VELQRILVGLFTLTLITGGGCSDAAPPPSTASPPPGRSVLDPAYRASGHMAAGAVFVHLFEWKWPDIAVECENVLGPVGFAAVQVSPPQEHIVLASSPWWQRYQPVSYGIERSRSGTRAEFTDMVNRCRTAGVDIYVDAVINHMSAGAGTGSNGTVYTKYNYPGLYTQSDFRTPCQVNNYQSAANVQDCELLGLAELRTDMPVVQQKIADYLSALIRLGVAGFRIDAAKHIQPVQLDQILARVNQAAAAEGRPLPYYFAEVIDYGGEAVRTRDYFGLAHASGGATDITEFKFRGVGDKFLGTGGQRLADLDPDGPAGRQFSESAWGLIPSDKAVVFLENHDTQRESGIGYRNGNVHRLANIWMLAQPYGYPSVMSSYAFDRGSQSGRDAGPPADAAGVTNDVSCAASFETATSGQWVCEHRDAVIDSMVVFRRTVAGTAISHWWDNGANAIAFSRGDRGFAAISRESVHVSSPVLTGLPAGTYCDVLTGGRTGTGCAGTAVVVDAAGTVQLELTPNSAIVIHR
jgi:alpha-amylase